MISTLILSIIEAVGFCCKGSGKSGTRRLDLLLKMLLLNDALERALVLEPPRQSASAMD